jgi:hypothetical protein
LNIVAIAKAIYDKAMDLFKNLAKKAVEGATVLYNKVKDQLSNLGMKASQFVRELWDKVRNAAGFAWNAMKNAAQAAARKIAAGAKAFGGWVSNLGSSLFRRRRIWPRRRRRRGWRL